MLGEMQIPSLRKHESNVEFGEAMGSGGMSSPISGDIGRSTSLFGNLRAPIEKMFSFMLPVSF
jgi:hypothetical protein